MRTCRVHGGLAINHVDKITAPLLVLATRGDQIARSICTRGVCSMCSKQRKSLRRQIYEAAPAGTLHDGDTPDSAMRYSAPFDFWDAI